MTPERTIPTVSEADDYFSRRLRSTAWTSASEADKEKALFTAETLVESAFSFNESAWRDENGRIVWNPNVDVAVFEEAIWLLQRDPFELPDVLVKGMRRAKVEGASVTFDKEFVVPLIPSVVETIVGELGVLLTSDDSMESVLFDY